MAKTVVVHCGVTGQETGATIDLVPFGSDTSSEQITSVTEKTVMKGSYSGAYTVAAGLYWAVLKDAAGNVLGRNPRELGTEDREYDHEPFHSDILFRTEIAAYTDATNFTLKEGPPNNKSLEGLTLQIVSASNALNFAFGVCKTWTGSTKAVVMYTDPGVFTAAADDVVIVRGSMNPAHSVLNALTADYQITASIGKAIADTVSDVATLISRVTAARAGYWDNLNVAGLIATTADVAGITQAQRVRIVCPVQMVRPASGNSVFRVWIYAYDEQHKGENLDSNPTVTATADDQTDLSANLGSVTKESTPDGVYRVDYTVAHDHDTTGVLFTVVATENSAAVTYSHASVVVDTIAVDFAQADRDKLEQLATDWTTARALLVDNLDVGGDVASDADMQTTLNRIGGFLGTTQNTILGYLEAIMSKTAPTPTAVPGDFSAVSDSLEAQADLLTAVQPTSSGTAQDGDTDRIQLEAGAGGATDFFKWQQIVLITGPGAGQARLITAFNNTTKWATVDRDWDIEPTDATQYQTQGAETNTNAIAESIEANFANIFSVANVPVGTPVGFPEFLLKGDAYTAANGRAINIVFKDENDTVLSTFGSKAPTDPDFSWTLRFLKLPLDRNHPTTDYTATAEVTGDNTDWQTPVGEDPYLQLQLPDDDMEDLVIDAGEVEQLYLWQLILNWDTPTDHELTAVAGSTVIVKRKIEEKAP